MFAMRDSSNSRVLKRKYRNHLLLKTRLLDQSTSQTLPNIHFRLDENCITARVYWPTLNTQVRVNDMVCQFAYGAGFDDPPFVENTEFSGHAAREWELLLYQQHRQPFLF